MRGGRGDAGKNHSSRCDNRSGGAVDLRDTTPKNRNWVSWKFRGVFLMLRCYVRDNIQRKNFSAPLFFYGRASQVESGLAWRLGGSDVEREVFLSLCLFRHLPPSSLLFDFPR